MKQIFLTAILATAIFTGCKKTDATATAADFNTTKATTISDFVNKVAMPGYAELQVKANTLNASINELNISTTETNLSAARTAWKDIRTTWERCEGYLFGPIEDNEYDPETDTWPVNFTDMDQLLANTSQGLTVADIEALPDRALRGYHPIEYILWGEGGTRTAASLTAREKEYMVSLSSLINTDAQLLFNSWAPDGGNYAAKVLTAGESGNTTFATRQAVFLAIVQGIADICGEVGTGKMKEPFDLAASNPAAGAQIVESPFSGNSVIDFKNNITGAYNVYLGKFNDSNEGTGLGDLVKLRNSSLDAELQQKFTAAIQSFDAITLPYEQAIATQRTQCAATMTAINNLAATIEGELKTFVITNITD